MDALVEMKIETVDDALKILDWSLTEERRLVRLLARHCSKSNAAAPRALEGSNR